MCGIAGVFNLKGEPVSDTLLKEMTDAIRHRGPDGEGFYVDRFLGLGHRRLAVIDLSPLGKQPMLTLDGRLAIIYNGEIYNFRELKHKLECLGYRFQSRTDTEVILNSYLEWGTDCVNMFNGMFAFAIWDKAKNELFIARDRYGIKPLYYTFIGNTFVFASEQKAIMVHDRFKKEIDLEALHEYFTFQNIFTDRTFFKDVKMFPAGCWTKIELGKTDNRLDLVRYWDYDFSEPTSAISEQEYIEELDRLFVQAVNRQLVSDVDVGAYLSGGIDSGSITAIAATHLPYMKTFTCGFDLNSASGLELGFDERASAEYMSYLFKTEHYEMILKAGDMERVMPKLVYHIEEPRVGQSYPNYYAAKLASKFVKVVLAGTGGDEIFGGYPWRYYRAVINDSFDQYVDKYYQFWQRLVPNDIASKFFEPIWNSVSHVNTRDIFKDVFKSHASKLETPGDYVNHSMYFEAKTFLHGLLVIEDKIGMSHGLETRLPFLDNDLVDFATKLPVELKLKNLANVVRLNENEPGPKTTMYYNTTGDGKLLLRKAMSHYIPDSVIDAKKQGFSAPDASWFRGESMEYVKTVLCNSKASIYNYVDYRTVIELLMQHFEGKENKRLLIWSLLNSEVWLREFL